MQKQSIWTSSPASRPRCGAQAAVRAARSAAERRNRLPASAEHAAWRVPGDAAPARRRWQRCGCRPSVSVPVQWRGHPITLRIAKASPLISTSGMSKAVTALTCPAHLADWQGSPAYSHRTKAQQATGKSVIGSPPVATKVAPWGLITGTMASILTALPARGLLSSGLQVRVLPGAPQIQKSDANWTSAPLDSGHSAH